MTSDSTIDIGLDYRNPWIQAGTLRPELDHNTGRHFDTPLRLVTSRRSFRQTRHLASPNISSIVHETSKFRYTWRESWCNCVWKTLYLIFTLTCHRRNSSPAISTSWPQPWSRGQASAYNWRNTPSELCDFHSQSQGRYWYFRTALETLSAQIGGEWSASRAKDNDGPFGVRIWRWNPRLGSGPRCFACNEVRPRNQSSGTPGWNYVEFIWQPGIWHHDRNHIVTNAQNNYILFEFCPSITNE